MYCTCVSGSLLLLSHPFTSARRPAPNDPTLRPTRRCAPLRLAVCRLPVAFLQPESCCRSSGAFDLPRALGVQRSGDPTSISGDAAGEDYPGGPARAGAAVLAVLVLALSFVLCFD